MAKIQSCLIVGGEHDGMRIQADTELHALDLPAKDGSLGSWHYYRQHFYAGNQEFIIYSSGLSLDQAVERIIARCADVEANRKIDLNRKFGEFGKPDPAQQLADIVLRLNPAAGEIGAGMLANMQELARRIVEGST